MRSRGLLLMLCALIGLAATVLAAAGGHWLAPHIVRQDLWQTAQLMHFAHLPCILICALAPPPAFTGEARAGGAGRWPRIAGWLWLTGIVVFCGTLYLRASAAPTFPSALAPVGGLLLMAGWASMLIAGIQSLRRVP